MPAPAQEGVPKAAGKRERSGTPPGRPTPRQRAPAVGPNVGEGGSGDGPQPPGQRTVVETEPLVAADGGRGLPAPSLATVVNARSRLQRPSESAADAIATKDMQEMFDVFDDDRGGAITAPEFADHLKAGLGFAAVDENGLEDLFGDIDNNGELDREEWTLMLRGILHKLEKKPVTPDDVRRALKATLLPAEHHGAARVSLAAIQPGFAKLGVRLSAEQAQGVMLSALGLGQELPPASPVRGFQLSENQADGPRLEDICVALVSSLLRKGSMQTSMRSSAAAQEAQDTSSLAGSLALFGSPIALELDDVDNLGPLLQMVPLFANLDDKKFSRLIEICQRSETRYKMGDAIVKQGEVGDELFLLLSGTAYASVGSDEHGKKPTIVKNYSKGDYFGERALMRNDGKRAANVFVSSTDALCCTISRQEFHDFVGGLDGRAAAEATDTNLGSRESGHVGRQLESWRQQVADVDAIEQWRALIRRFLWLDMLHNTIDEHRTMQGRKAAYTQLFKHLSTSGGYPFGNLYEVVVLVITAILVPLRAGFDQIDGESPKFWFTFDLISDLYFWFDMVLNFRTAYFDSQQKLVHNDKKVAWNYATGWFIIDFASVLPVSYIIYIGEPSALPWRAEEGGGGSGSTIKLLKILRLFRLTKMLKLLRMKELLERHEGNELLMRFMGSMTIVKLFIQLLYMCHFLACFFYMFGDISESGRPDGTVIHGWVYRQQWGAYGWAGRYLYSFFLSITDDTTALAETDVELLWSGMQHILYEAFLAYLTGVFAGEVISGNAAQQEYAAKMDQVKYFMQHYQLPLSLRKQVNTFYAHLNDTKTFFDEEAVLTEFPPAIRKKVIHHIYKTIVDNRSVKANYPFLSRLPERLRYELCRVLRPLSMACGDVVYTEGEYGDEMYLVDTGQCVAYKWTGDASEDHKKKLNERKQTIYATGQPEEGLTLHVRGVGGSTAEPGVYEDVQALRTIFEEYGQFRDALIRHRVDKETGKNTSYALVTMCDVESAQRVLDAAVTVGVLRPDGVKLQVSSFEAKTAMKSSGAMRRTAMATEMMGSRAHAIDEEAQDQTRFGMHHAEYGERLGEFNDGSFFGEEALLGENIQRIATVVAVAPISKIWYLDRAACSSFSRQEDVHLFYRELRLFARKRQRLNELRAKRMAQLDLRLATLKKEFSIAQMLAGGGLPAGARIPSSKELPMIDAVFSALILGDVRDAVKFRCVALDFEQGDAVQSRLSADTGTSALESGVLVLASGELLASSVVEESDLDSVAAGNVGSMSKENLQSHQQLDSSRTSSNDNRVSIRPGSVFSGSISVRKVKKLDLVDRKQGSELLPHPKGLHVSEVVVVSQRASVLWLDNRLFEFAHDPNSLETTFAEGDSLDDMSDDPDDAKAGEDADGARSPPLKREICELQTQMSDLKRDVGEKMQRLEQAHASMQQELNSRLDALLVAVASPSRERLHAVEPEPELAPAPEPEQAPTAAARPPQGARQPPRGPLADADGGHESPSGGAIASAARENGAGNARRPSDAPARRGHP